jgi:hypothetical protein
LFHADATRVENREIELTVLDAVIGGLAEPESHTVVIGRAADASRIENSQVMHRLGVALLRRRQIKIARPE